MSAPRVTRCTTWLRLRMRGLRYREISRAVGPWMGALGWALSRVTELSSNELAPLEVTLIEPIAGEPQVGREIERLGFTKLAAFTLPEFTGENSTHVYLDHAGTTLAEAVWFKAVGGERTTVALSSLVEGGSVTRLRTVELPKDAPLDPPPGWLVRFQAGALGDRVDGHRAALAALTGKPVSVEPATLYDHLHIGHLEAMRHAFTRGAYQAAEPAQVEALFAAKGLTREGDATAAAAPPQVAHSIE
ncbi:MAG: hypothetical protein HYS27_00380 [Deltaproteobacteria bacterium]|nr:hypothetical protein [Deltaproteobacteria bacterium]